MPPDRNHSARADDLDRRTRLKKAKGIAAREFLMVIVLAGAAAVAMVVMGGGSANGNPLEAVTHIRY